MSNPRTPTGTPADDDPTGMRALLSSLPEPAPMPPELVQRISASLAEEQAARAAHGSSDRYAATVPAAGDVRGPTTPSEPTNVTTLRPRRPLLPRLLGGLAAAAAVVAVGALGVNLLGGSAGSATGGSASLGAQPASTGDVGGAQTDTGGESGGGATEVPTPAAPSASRPGDPPRSIGALVVATDTAYTRATLAEQAADLWKQTESKVGTDKVPLAASGTGDLGELRSTTGILTCLSTLGLSDADRVVIDLATFAGAPAAVVVSSKDGTVSARAVPPGCGAGMTEVLASVPLP